MAYFPYFRYFEYIKDLVYSNLSQSQPGGVPGTAKLVQSYLKLKHASATPGLEVSILLYISVNHKPFYVS